MGQKIPSMLLAVCAEIASTRESHATLDSLFTYAGATGDPPGGPKPAKALEWLRTTNKDESVQPLEILGRIIESYMEEDLDANTPWGADRLKEREKIERALSQCRLKYVTGGRILGSSGTPTRALEDYIRDRDLTSIDAEFHRALENVDSSPREAVSAASNLLESVCKVYIVEQRLAMPAKQDLQPVWAIVRKDLGFDPSVIEDGDLKKILSGMISTVDGIGSLRTHASSAHGAGAKSYRLEPRHARLAVHASHTVALFILETWDKKNELGFK